MKAILVTALTLALSAPAALAATAVPLDPGKPAGVHQAQLLDDGNGMLVVAGAALVGIGIALATASGDAAQPTATNNPPPTTGTSP
jgi:hypothetical protein